jgi:hypothetical protein
MSAGSSVHSLAAHSPVTRASARYGFFARFLWLAQLHRSLWLEWPHDDLKIWWTYDG